MSTLPPASLACTICSEYYKPSDNVLCTSCGHVFHQSCYQDWQIRSLTCPDCRSAVPQTQRLYLHFEEHTEAERQLHQTKTELIVKIKNLEQQLSESEANFIDALQALSAKEEQLTALNNEVEFRKAQNESYEQQLNILKEKQEKQTPDSNKKDANISSASDCEIISITENSIEDLEIDKENTQPSTSKAEIPIQKQPKKILEASTLTTNEPQNN